MKYVNRHKSDDNLGDYSYCLQSAKAFYDNYEYDNALQLLNQAVCLKPDDPEAYSIRGFIYSIKGDIDSAIQVLTIAIRLKPDYAVAYYQRGIAFYAKGDVDNALQDYTQAIRFKPDAAEAYLERGIAFYLAKNDCVSAIRDITQAILIKPEFAEAYKNRGFSFYKTGDYDSAIQDLTQAIRLKPDFAVAYFQRGTAFHNKGDYESAIQDYTQAICLKPDFTEAFSQRELAYQEIGGSESSRREADRCAEAKANKITDEVRSTEDKDTIMIWFVDKAGRKASLKVIPCGVNLIEQFRSYAFQNGCGTESAIAEKLSQEDDFNLMAISMGAEEPLQIEHFDSNELDDLERISDAYKKAVHLKIRIGKASG